MNKPARHPKAMSSGCKKKKKKKESLALSCTRPYVALQSFDPRDTIVAQIDLLKVFQVFKSLDDCEPVGLNAKDLELV